MKCDYCEPAAQAAWQGTDKTARKGNRYRTGATTKYACTDCKHFLSNPVTLDAPKQPATATKQEGLL